MPDEADREVARDPQDLERLLVARQRAGDIDGMVALYEPNAVLDCGDGQLRQGREAIRAYFAEQRATGKEFDVGDQRPAIVSGDLALTSTSLPDGSVTAEVARRQVDGTWLWVIDKFSMEYGFQQVAGQSSDREDALENPEVHTPHVRHGGLPRWLELVIAVTALITSVSSIAIAVHHGQIMEKLVQANSIPYMQGGFSNVTLEGDQVLSLDLLNRGVGPAHEQSLRVKVGGRYVRSLSELIVASMGPQRGAEAEEIFDPMQNRVQTRFIPGGQEQMVFRIARTPENAELWDLLNASQSKWDVEYCYCSVFQECWQVLGKWQEPAPVEACRRNEAREFMP